MAVRQVRDPHLAEEVAQAVFIILARKADSIGDNIIFPGWLCRTARYVGAEALRKQRRRQQREQEAHMQSLLNEPEADAWTQIAPLLDGALATLGRKDHDALVLRFFENKNFAEVGAALGTGEDNARMRVNRALEKLQKFFTKRGVSSTAAMLAGAISANSVSAAPAGLALKISAVAVAKGAAAGTSTLTLVKGALKIMAWTKMKTAIVVGMGVLLAASTSAALWSFHFDRGIWQSRFETAYQLKAGEVLRYIAPPFIDERLEYYRTEKTLQSQAKAIPAGPDTFVFKQNKNGQLQQFECGFGFKQHSLEQILDDPLGFWRYEFEGPQNLLNLNLPGDWTIRDYANREALLAALEPIIFKSTRRKIHFEKRTVNRSVIVANGGAKIPVRQTKVQIYSEKQNVRGGGTGSGNLQRLLGTVGEQLNTYIVDEAQTDSQYSNLFEWAYYPDSNYLKMGNRREELTNKVLKNLSSQLGLTFTREQRSVEMWMISEQ